MSRNELTFMLNKIAASIAQTYQIKKIIMLHQVDKFLETVLRPNEEFIEICDWINRVYDMLHDF
jgi:hypothetical protein